MNETNNRETRTGRVADRGPATIGVPAKDLVAEVQATHGVRARGKLHAARRHLVDVCSACLVEHAQPLEEVRKRLAVAAAANEPEPAAQLYSRRRGRGRIGSEAGNPQDPEP
jgi:hypothetical protein